MLARVVVQSHGYLVPDQRQTIAGPITSKDLVDEWDASRGVYNRLGKNVSKLAL